ncbi:hypothetical protein F2Q69_00024610 [Brassica cretica]|uniref:Secreted protein n=1 Tax=Brassica cretica TaxID=69181 RepID=A0A8S9QK98_BRACR|nr:hypothetical protein F2Q69_00024610 [Brassica cretica]
MNGEVEILSFFLSFLFSVPLLFDDNIDFESHLGGSRRRLCWFLSSTVDLVDVSISYFLPLGGSSWKETTNSLPLGGSRRSNRRFLSLWVNLVEGNSDFSPYR